MKKSKRGLGLRVLLPFIFILGLVAVLGSVGEESREADSCLKCHSNQWGPTLKFQHPLIKEGKCKSCHSTYDEAVHQEAVRPVLETCQECHSSEKLGRSHPVGGGVIDPQTGDSMTCVSACHTPHGSDYEHQLPVPNAQDLCLGCHEGF